MAVLTPASVFAPGRKPPKNEIIQLLEQMIGASNAPAVVRQSKNGLDLVTPASENYGGLVLNDPDPSNNGYYSRSAGVWVKGRGFPDTFAKLVLSGPENAQIGEASAGVNPADVLVYFASVAVENTGPMTLSIGGEAPRPVVNAAGNPISAGEWAGVVLFFLNGSGQYQLLLDAGAVAAAAQSASDAAESLAEMLLRYLGAFSNDALATAAAGGSPSEGQLFFSTSEGKLKAWHSGSWQASDLALADGAVTPAKLAPNQPALFRDVIRAAERKVEFQRQTNRLLYGSFVRGSDGWAVSNPAAARVFFSFETDTTDNMARYFARAKGQLDASASGQTLLLQPSSISAVEASKASVVGFWGSAYGAVDPLPVNIQVKCYDEGGALLGTLTVAKSVSATRSPTASLYLGLINAQGGSAPAWPAGTVSASVGLSLVSTAAQGVHCMAMFVIPADEYPGNPATTSVVNFGGGTHEALAVGDYLYVLNHGFNWLVKFDAALKYVSHISVDDYPHDIVAIGGDLWVAYQDSASLQRVNIATFTVSNTYAITGARSGFGLATDGARLWLGAGTNAQGCAIYTVNTSTGALALLSNDVNTGAANVPVQYLDGSVWTIHEGNGQVKRINPTGGATQATISANVGKLYGLGAGGGFIWANGRNGVAKIDPATNAVVARYMFRTLTSGQSNVLVHNGFALACGEQGVMAINIDTGEAREILLDSGACKWVKNMPSGEIAVGAYAAPWIFVLKA